MTAGYAVEQLLDAIEGLADTVHPAGLATLAADVRRELAIDDTGETLLTAWLCVQRGGLVEMPDSDVVDAAKAARILVDALSQDLTRRAASGETCRPVCDAEGNVIATVRSDLLDDDGQAAVRALVDHVRSRMQEDDRG